jgi:hypothetical protein
MSKSRSSNWPSLDVAANHICIDCRFSRAPARDGLTPAAASWPGGCPTLWSGRGVGAVGVSFAEHLHLAGGVLDVDGELIELLNELLDVLRLELGEVDRYP